MYSNITLADYVSRYDQNTLKVDHSFNRRTVWDAGNHNRYYESLTRGRAPMPFVMANIDRCLKHSQKIGDKISIDYYTELDDRGYYSLSLDGQNRGQAIVDLLTNKRAITGTFIDADGKTCVVKNKFFKDLPQRLQDKFRTGCHVSITTYEDALFSELSQIFKNIQDGCPLNSQEKRNATPTPIASWVRYHSKEMGQILSKLIPSKKIDRMIDDEIVAKMAMILSKENEWGLGPNEIDKWYDMGKGFFSLNDENIPYKPEELNRVENIFNYFSSVWSKVENKKKFTFKMWWVTLFACEWAHDNDYYIIEPEKFFNSLRQIDSRLLGDSSIQYGKDREDYIEAGKDPDDISQENYYYRYSAVPHLKNSRKRWKETIVSEIKKAKLDSIRLK